MLLDRDSAGTSPAGSERRAEAQPQARVLGHVVQCDGARAVVAAYAEPGDNTVNRLWTVGRLISMNLGQNRIVGLVYEINRLERVWSETGQNPIEVHIELAGEIRDDPQSGRPVFDRGITVYPHVGAIAHRIRARDLQAIYELSGKGSAVIGTLSQDENVEACVSIKDMLQRHFAVVGTTGVGKSTAVSLLMRKAIEAEPDLRILVLDPHNEFAAVFPGRAHRVDTTTLDLPFWLFRLEELVEVLFRGREASPEEVELLRDLIPQAKNLYRMPAVGGLVRRLSDGNVVTADTPIPYRMADLIRLIDERIGALDGKQDRPVYRALRVRIEAALQDPRYRFMFASRLIEDTLPETIGNLFRIPQNGKPITCFEMAGLPSEIVNSVCSVLARLAFDLAMWSNGGLKLLVLCEEAHRYMPADPKLGFAPTRHALSRIAKEGRKYGCYLGVVTQRPGELDPTILSQCSTIFAMRLANERDQEIIRSAIADSSASTLSFLSSMGQREAIAFGEGVATTMRMKFEKLAPEMLPGMHKDQGLDPERPTGGTVDIATIVERMRAISRPMPATGAETVEPRAQAGDPGFRQAGEPGFRPTLAAGGSVFRFQED